MAYALLGKKSILHELEEKVTKSEMNDNPTVCAGLSQKNKTELRDVSKAFSIPLSGHETKPQLTRKINEVQAEREPLRQAIVDFGRHRGKTYEWVCAQDKQYCEWAVLTVVEDGATASPQLKKFASHVEQSRENVSEGDELTTTEVAQSNNDAGPRGRTGRPDETSGTSDSEVQCTLKTMNEQQRAMLRKSGTQLFMDEIDQLTSEAGHIDLAEIRVSCLDDEHCESHEILKTR